MGIHTLLCTSSISYTIEGPVANNIELVVSTTIFYANHYFFGPNAVKIT